MMILLSHFMPESRRIAEPYKNYYGDQNCRYWLQSCKHIIFAWISLKKTSHTKKYCQNICRFSLAQWSLEKKIKPSQERVQGSF